MYNIITRRGLTYLTINGKRFSLLPGAAPATLVEAAKLAAERITEQLDALVYLNRARPGIVLHKLHELEYLRGLQQPQIDTHLTQPVICDTL